MNIEFYGITIQSIGEFGIELSVFYGLVIAFIMLDLNAGIRKAKEAGVYRSSRKLRDTVNKMNKYFNAVFMFTILDMTINFSIACLGMSYPSFPYFTLLATIGVGVIEIKSVYEKTEDKDKANVQEAARVLSQLIQARDPRSIAEMLNKLGEAQKNTDRQ